MGKPAVKKGKLTAGRLTQKNKFWKSACVAFLIGAVVLGTPAEAARPERTTRTVVVTERVPFDTTYIDLPNRYQGYQEPVSPGIDGSRKVEAQVVYEGSRPVKVIGIKSTVLSTPTNQVTRRGTKVLRTATVDGSSWKHSFIHPLKREGWISADFYDYPHHNGVDFAAPHGTPVYAAAGGVVSLAGWYGEYGYCVIVDHPDGSQTLYAHNSALSVRSGQTVRQGQQLANVGTTGNSTGNHLHFEMRVGGAFLNPLVYIDQ